MQKYDIGEMPPQISGEVVALLEQAGFPVSPDARIVSGVDAVVARCVEMAGARHDLPYEIDGVVTKVDDLGLHQRLARFHTRVRRTAVLSRQVRDNSRPLTPFPNPLFSVRCSMFLSRPEIGWYFEMAKSKYL